MAAGDGAHRAPARVPRACVSAAALSACPSATVRSGAVLQCQKPSLRLSPTWLRTSPPSVSTTYRSTQHAQDEGTGTDTGVDGGVDGGGGGGGSV